jgi:hypothetical protein
MISAEDVDRVQGSEFADDFIGFTVVPQGSGQFHEVLVVQLLLMECDDDCHHFPGPLPQLRLCLPEICRLGRAHAVRRVLEHSADLPAYSRGD